MTSRYGARMLESIIKAQTDENAEKRPGYLGDWILLNASEVNRLTGTGADQFRKYYYRLVETGFIERDEKELTQTWVKLTPLAKTFISKYIE